MNRTMNSAFFSMADEILSSFGLSRQRMLGPFGSFAAGAIVGVVAGLLLAPSSGEELLTKVAERAKSLRDTMAKSLNSGEEDTTGDKGNRTRGNQSKYAAAQG